MKIKDIKFLNKFKSFFIKMLVFFKNKKFMIEFISFFASLIMLGAAFLQISVAYEQRDIAKRQEDLEDKIIKREEEYSDLSIKLLFSEIMYNTERSVNNILPKIKLYPNKYKDVIYDFNVYSYQNFGNEAIKKISIDSPYLANDIIQFYSFIDLFIKQTESNDTLNQQISLNSIMALGYRIYVINYKSYINETDGSHVCDRVIPFEKFLFTNIPKEHSKPDDIFNFLHNIKY